MSCGCGTTNNQKPCDLPYHINPCSDAQVRENWYSINQQLKCFCETTTQLTNWECYEYEFRPTQDASSFTIPVPQEVKDSIEVKQPTIYWNGLRQAKNTMMPDWTSFALNTSNGDLTTSSVLAADCLIAVEIWYKTTTESDCA